MEYLSQVDAYLQKYINTWNFHGLVSIVKDGNILLQKEAGLACVEFGIKNTQETLFSLGSNSKQFTAFSIMQFVDKDEISLQESANKYLPGEFFLDSRITVHHLLSHTSGLYNCYNFDDDFFGIYNRSTFSREDFFQRYIDRELIFEPGTQYSYNNANYNLLAWIIENISHKSFNEYLQEHIFLPLGMTHSTLDMGTNIIKNKAFPYDYDRDGIVRCQYYNEKFSIGAGAIVSNCSDLIQWHNCLQHKDLLSKAAYDKFLNENLNNYCYGLEKQTIHNQTCYLHGGDHLGVMTYMLNFFDEDLFILILSNAGFGNQYKMGTAICDILFTGKDTSSEYRQTVKLTAEEAFKYEGTYLDRKIELRRHNGNWEFVRFNGELRIPLRPVGNHQFSRIDSDQYSPYTLKECDDGEFEFFGYKRKSK